MPNRDGSKTSVSEFFGDGVHEFDIVDRNWTLLTELESKVGNLLPFFARLRAGDYKVAELRDLIRIALIGGGKTPSEAMKLVTAYFDLSPVAEHLPLAITISGAALYGTPEVEAADGSA